MLIEEMAAAGGQVAIVDPTGAWWGIASSSDGKGADVPVVVFGGHHGDVPLERVDVVDALRSGHSFEDVGRALGRTPEARRVAAMTFRGDSYKRADLGRQAWVAPRRQPSLPLVAERFKPVASALEALVEAYPHVDTRFGISERCPDWERVAENFDAVHLTDAGQWATRLSAPLNLYGWDCESTLWFRFAFAAVEDQGWVRCAAADPWWEEEAVA